ncbi:MAG TPA: aspartate kinase [Chloroflexota bacterium]|nr:aspartate kinase [Chloroflexota bacterium]
MLVQKFGGSSLKNPERIGAVADRVAATAERQPLVVVVSAMGDTTDHLIDLARDIAPTPERREIDMLLATGEQVSASLLAMALHARGRPAISLTGWQAGIRTDQIFGSARIREIAVDRLRHELDNGRVPIVTGFQGIAADTGWDEVTTLGRGGSDATAVALAAGLGAACHIYTDVAGIYTADPRVEPRARKLPTISYEEMLELSQYGAQVMMPRSVELAQIWHVPLEVRSSYTDETGTRIEGAMEYAQRVAGVAHQRNVAKVTLVHLADRPGVAHAVFAALAERHVNADLIVQNMGFEGYADLSYCVPATDLGSALEATHLVRERVGARDVLVKENLAKVSVVGAGLSSGAGYAATMFGTLADLGINIDMISTSGVRITCVIEGDEVERAVRGLHEAFHLEAEAWEASA